MCGGTGFLPDDLMDAVTRELNSIYSGDYADPTAMEVERVKLLYSLCGYRWVYADQPEEVLTREQYFDMSLINPKSGRSLLNVRLVGCIDKIIMWNGRPAIKEHKSTGKSVDPDSTYWGHLNLDTQTTLYLYAARRMQADDLLQPWGIKSTDPPINTILYDVWHKPTISPKKLTQAESKAFMADGMYCGQEFEVLPMTDGVEEMIMVNGKEAQYEPGAKEGTFAIRETPEMYGARLLADIGERPEFYFRCVELSKTDKELERFEQKLVNTYRSIQFARKTDCWDQNEKQCEATFKCDYIGQCYNGVEIDPGLPPEGMKCIFNIEEKT